MNYKYILFFLLGIDAFVLLTQTTQLSISYHEASMLYDKFSFLQGIIKTSLYFFGQNDFALRLPMIIFHLLSALLLYTISKKYITNEKNRLWLILVFVLIPGVISSALLVDSAGLVVFGLLLFVYVYENNSRIFLYVLLGIYAFVDGGFTYLFLALAAYSLYIKDKILFIVNILALLISVYLYGFNTEGLPEGHFLDFIGIFAAIFTPILFIYIFYILYRRLLTKNIDLLWFISFVPLIFSLLLSFRQRVDVEHFAPYLIIALPLAAQTFYSSYRIRLKIFRKKYKILFTVSLIFLLLNSFLVFFNKYLYNVLENPRKHFAYKMHIAKELADKLKKSGITCVHTNDQMLKRLKFYGVTECNENILTEKDMNNPDAQYATISYKNKIVYIYNVTKINNL
ncbi:hypothetical protein KKG72_02330 [bacterium]|nr:hypothetical protein [bacterium]